MRGARFTALLLVFSLAALSSRVSGQPIDDTDRWRSVVTALEPAAFVSVRLKDGHRFKGTVLSAGDRTFVFMPRTRIPVPSREIAYADLATLERASQGMSPGMKVLIGAGAGVGGFLLIMLSILAAYD
jgi:hypothetical protein